MYKNFSNKRRELKKKDRIAILERDGLLCRRCGITLKLISIEKRVSVEGGIFHHIVPQIYGGENSYNNACLVCVSCHNKIHSGDEDKNKYFKMYEEYIKTGFLEGELWEEKKEKI